jgi:hypothetical protein
VCSVHLTTVTLSGRWPAPVLTVPSTCIAGVTPASAQPLLRHCGFSLAPKRLRFFYSEKGVDETAVRVERREWARSAKPPSAHWHIPSENNNHYGVVLFFGGPIYNFKRSGYEFSAGVLWFPPYINPTRPPSPPRKNNQSIRFLSLPC